MRETMKKETRKYEDLIYDVGMCKGEDTAFYLKKGFRVIGFEADPDLAGYCRDKFAQAVEQKRLRIVEGAIASSGRGQSKVRFLKNIDVPAWGTICEDWVRRNAPFGRQKIIEVDAVDFVECIGQYGIPYYMKIDVEGADIMCLMSLLDYHNKPDYISIESEKVSFRKLKREIVLLEQLGYREFMAVQQATVPLVVVPNPPREGVYATHQFRFGSSGLFGKELSGLWKNRGEILREYMSIFTGYKFFGDHSIVREFRGGRVRISLLSKILGRPIPGWYDTHARRCCAVKVDMENS